MLEESALMLHSHLKALCSGMAFLLRAELAKGECMMSKSEVDC